MVKDAVVVNEGVVENTESAGVVGPGAAYAPAPASADGVAAEDVPASYAPPWTLAD